MKTKTVRTAHYKGTVFSPRLSKHFHTVHLACTRHLLQIKKKETKEEKKKAHLQKEKEEIKETIERWLIVQLPSIGMVWF